MADLIRQMRHRRLVFRIGRALPDRSNPMGYLGRGELFERYRFQPATIYTILEFIKRELDTPTSRSSPLPPIISLLVTLQFFASGAHYIIIGDTHSVSKASVCRAVIKTTKAIASLAPDFIKFPHVGEYQELQRQFYNIARFPKVIGAVDGTHIGIKSPSENEAAYVNRKGVHSINVQVVCDANFKVLNVVAKWPGSVHDSRIFRESELCRRLENDNNDAVLLGDSGYPCKPFLLTPYIHRITQFKEGTMKLIAKQESSSNRHLGLSKEGFLAFHMGSGVLQKEHVKLLLQYLCYTILGLKTLTYSKEKCM